MGAPAHNMLPAQLHNQPGFQHINNHAPSASPPVNGIGFAPRHGTPQPQDLSRPASRNHIQQINSQYGNHAQAHATPPPPAQNSNGYAYMAHPSIYNPNTNPDVNGRVSQQGQYHQFAHPAHPGSHQQAQTIPQPHQHATQQTPHLNLPTHQNQSINHAYMQDQGRHSLPPSIPSDAQQYHYRSTLALPDPTQQAGDVKAEGGSSPKPKSRSIFTPIDDQTSVFSRHLFGRTPLRESPQRDTSVKQETKPPEPASQTLPLPRGGPPPPPPPPNRAASEPQKPPSKSSLSDSRQASRPKPRLKVQIPSDHSDSGSATGESSPQDSSSKTASTSTKKSCENGTAGVVQLLPPPSPGAGGPILSAGAQGPPNPFARPAPPGSNAQNGSGYGGSSSSSSNQNMETPISALPSRFVSDALLPSPSSFFPEWGFGRTGPDTSLLPSPLPFTPAVQTGPGFSRDEDAEKKRKSADEGESTTVDAKKAKISS